MLKFSEVYTYRHFIIFRIDWISQTPFLSFILTEESSFEISRVSEFNFVFE